MDRPDEKLEQMQQVEQQQQVQQPFRVGDMTLTQLQELITSAISVQQTTSVPFYDKRDRDTRKDLAK